MIERVGGLGGAMSGDLVIASEGSNDDMLSQWLGGGTVYNTAQSNNSRVTKSSKRGSMEDMKNVYYRFVDPWEVESFVGGAGALKSGFFGRNFYDNAGVQQGYGKYGRAGLGNGVEEEVRSTFGPSGLSLWSSMDGSRHLEQLVAKMKIKNDGTSGNKGEDFWSFKHKFMKDIREYLYRNSLFDLVGSTNRFVAIVQVELLDLKNLSASHIASPAMSTYAVVRLRRAGSTAPVTNKSRSKDSFMTEPVKLTNVGKGGGSKDPVGWGSVACFRFALPEGVGCSDIKSFDESREKLFRGPPSVVFMNVYEKKPFFGDLLLGGGEVGMGKVGVGQPWENWCPLNSMSGGHPTKEWFVKVRVSTRFEIMRIISNVGL